MKLIGRKNIGKLFFLSFAVLIGIGSLFYTNSLVTRLKEQERKSIRLWAEAIIRFNLTDPNAEIDILTSSIIENNTTVPVILTTENDSIIDFRNFVLPRVGDPRTFIEKNLEKIKEDNMPIIINIDNKHYNLIYFKNSTILTMLTYYPYAQLGIILMFIIVAYLAFKSSRRAEQNQLWVAMSKETAHQLGTPTSSLAGWIEILQQRHPEVLLIRELSLDVQRLEKVTERFSRIGSKPALARENINDIISGVIEYLRSRVSSRIKFVYEKPGAIMVPVNESLFEWVIEVISKNAIDAMEGNGILTIRVTENEKNAFIDISDTGKGIPKSLFKKIFNPGFTTKQRGWGLGLSLARRIVEEYHHGKIFVRNSEVGNGTTIRILMNK